MFAGSWFKAGSRRRVNGVAHWGNPVVFQHTPGDSVLQHGGEPFGFPLGHGEEADYVPIPTHGDTLPEGSSRYEFKAVLGSPGLGLDVDCEPREAELRGYGYGYGERLCEAF